MNFSRKLGRALSRAHLIVPPRVQAAWAALRGHGVVFNVHAAGPLVLKMRRGERLLVIENALDGGAEVVGS